MSDESNMKPIGDEGGYDLVELKEAKEAFEEKHGDGVKTSGLVDVEPILIQVSNEIVVEQKEYEARTVLIEYDAYGEVVSVELL